MRFISDTGVLHAHRVVLAAGSPFFEEDMGTGTYVCYRVNTGESFHGLWRVLSYIYTGDYPEDSPGTLDGGKQLHSRRPSEY